MDKITLQRIELIHPILKNELHIIYKEVCERLTGTWFCRFTSTYRSYAEQDAIYAKGRTDKSSGIVTFARGGESYHCFGLATDICLTNGKEASWDINKDYDSDGMSDWLEVVAVFEKYGWKWGLKNAAGKHWDFPHFQKDFGYSIQQLQKMQKVGNYPIINK